MAAASRVAIPRAIAAVALIALWEAMSFSGLFFRDVIPSLDRVAIAFCALVADAGFWTNFAATVGELAMALLIGGIAGMFVGFALGASRFLSGAFERWLDYLGPTPKIILFPVLIMLCGVGQGSKVAMGAVSCFFPVAITVAAGVRGVDPALLRVGKSFRASFAQMVRKIYFPAMLPTLINGFRLGFGVAVIGVLLAETKLSKEGLGFLVMQAYARFDMPRMYALLITAVVLAAGVNAVMGRVAKGF
jgi:NitT/TauT family transport system permease protein